MPELTVIRRVAVIAVLAAASLLSACRQYPPDAHGHPVYYDPKLGISSDGSVYPRPR